MAITIYTGITDVNNVTYNFDVNSHWANNFGGWSEQDLPFPVEDYKSNNTSPFSRVQPFSGYIEQVTFSYNGHTLDYYFQNGGQVVYLDDRQLFSAGPGANQDDAQISGWFCKNDNGIVAFNTQYVGSGWSSVYCVSYGASFSAEDSTIIDSILTNSVQPEYTWQSVPSVSGKNGILQSLVQIKEEALNDGEPVSEASVTSFDSLGNINIPSVIDEQMPVDLDKLTSITAVYLIPKLSVGTYSKIQLWLKKKNIPTSEEDADYVVNLTEPTNILRIGSASVNRLQESTKYIAIVAVEDEIGTTAQSEPAEIVTGKIPGIFKIVIATSSGVKDELKEVIVVEKQ